MKYPKDMDKECIALCDALNEFKKTETSGSCCGHLNAPFRIWFRCSSFTELAIISRAVDRRYAGTSQLWRVVSDNSDTHPRFGFMLESENRYVSTLEMQEDTNKIADNIRYWRDNFIEYFRSDGEVMTKSSKHVSSLPSVLDEAAEEQWAAMEYASKTARESTSVRDWCTDDIVNAFKAGVKFRAEQGYNREAEVKEDAGGYPYIDEIELYDYDNDKPLAKKGDKVVVQIRKKSNTLIEDIMSKRAVEKAQRAYADHEGFTFEDERKAYAKGYEQAEKDLGWHSIKESLPPIDEEVIVLTDVIHGKIVPGAHMICYAHRPNPKGWDGKNIETGEVKHHDVVTYDGWNIPGVTHWMHCPKLEEEL